MEHFRQLPYIPLLLRFSCFVCFIYVIMLRRKETSGGLSCERRWFFIWGVYLWSLGIQIPEGKRRPGRPRYRWEDNIKVDLQEVGCGVWTGLSWLRIETGGRRL
jgi:hypothetical protein